jgi:hypothetical protein
MFGSDVQMQAIELQVSKTSTHTSLHTKLLSQLEKIAVESWVQRLQEANSLCPLR